MGDIALECLSTDDGEPWGVYAYGHIDPASISLERINWALDHYGGFDPVEAAKVEHLWMYATREKDGDDHDEDHPWKWCDPGVEGAIAVTGVKYPYETPKEGR